MVWLETEKEGEEKMNPIYNDEIALWVCSKCNKKHKSYSMGSVCCLSKIKLRYKLTGEVIELPFGIRKLGYSNELVICETFGYDKGQPSPSNDPYNWEIVEIEGFKKC